MSKRLETFGFLSKLLNNSKKAKLSFSKVLPVWEENYRPTPKLLVKTFYLFVIFNFPF